MHLFCSKPFAFFSAIKCNGPSCFAPHGPSPPHAAFYTEDVLHSLRFALVPSFLLRTSAPLTTCFAPPRFTPILLTTYQCIKDAERGCIKDAKNTVLCTAGASALCIFDALVRSKKDGTKARMPQRSFHRRCIPFPPSVVRIEDH